MRTKVFDLRKEFIKVANEIYALEQKGEASDLLLKAYHLLHEYSYAIQSFHSVCACTFCGAEYWCRDVSEVCPNCGVNVSEADMLNWTIFSTDTDEEYTKHIWDEYKRRGDSPLMPKGSPVELLQMQLRGFREALYKHTAQDHQNYKHIQRAELKKIKWLKWKIRQLRGKTTKPFGEEVYSCNKCGWQGYLGEAQQHITGVDACWLCPKCQRTKLEERYDENSLRLQEEQ
jgi:hypothetical protein